MNRIFTTVLLCAISFLSFVWSQTGHRVTGYIADKYLNKKARKAIERILNGKSMAMTSNWMDDVKSDSAYRHMDDWHWVTIPDGMTYEESQKNPKGDIIMTLERVVTALKSKKLSPEQEAEYVKILIHLVGDIHQPLHVGRPDRGGNDVKVMWFRTDTNLHSVWDGEMIDGTRLSYSELAESLGKPAPDQIKAWQQSTVRDWANESIGYRTQVYDYGNGRIGYDYKYKYFGIVEKRLLQAGIRLAGILNEIYGS